MYPGGAVFSDGDAVEPVPMTAVASSTSASLRSPVVAMVAVPAQVAMSPTTAQSKRGSCGGGGGGG
ncbi:MAG TPA: hypothetical protein VMD28_10475, partial [Acidimicrobiales bacterium]|nr:hypothetical protein [Acidimicrobiales bacterium]